LLPLVQNPDSRSLQILNAWLVSLDSSLNQYVHLLLAEAGSISKQTLLILTELLSSEEDRTRYRAALALHGDTSDSENSLPTSTLGLETLLQLAQNRIELLENNSTISVIIVWTFQRIYHNDIQIIETLIQVANSDTAASKKALIVLKHIQQISPNAWSTFLNGLKDGSLEIQSSLIHSLCILLARNRINSEMWQAILPILRDVDIEVLRNYKFVLNGPAKLVESASLAWEMSIDSKKYPFDVASEAEKIFLSKQQNMLEISQEDDSNILRDLLASIGNLYLVNQAYTDRVSAASASVEEKPQLLEVLIDLLSKRLQEAAFEDDFRLMTCDLLNVVAASAECLPNTFYRKVSGSPTLQLRLREVVETHNTFPGRQSALILLSYFHCITEETIAALEVSLRDVVEVQNVAIQTLERYREIDQDSDLLTKLFENLLDSSPSVGYVTARMLAAIARNAYFNPDLREKIIAAFIEAIDNNLSRRDVYLLVKKEISKNNHIYQVEYKGQLHEIFYEIIIQISGISNLFQFKD
jgi:hypothetical protein